MKVSVVIPKHNRASKLKAAINSILKQTYSNFEIIVVSDGSSDETCLEMDIICKRNEKIFFYHYPDSKGANYARNYGIEKSSGEFIAFLDDDDEWTCEKLQLQVELMKNEEVGITYTGIRCIYDDQDVDYTSVPKKKGNLGEEILIQNWIGTTSSVMVRKNIIIKAGLFDEKLEARQDYDLWIRICQLTKVDFVSASCVEYRNSLIGNQISSNTERYVRATNSIFAKYNQLYKKLPVEKFNQAMSNSNLEISNKYMRNSNGKKARKFAVKAFKLYKSKKGIAYFFLSFLNYRAVLKIRSHI